MSTFINRSRLMLESGLSHRCSSSYIGSDRCSLSYSDRCLSVRWNRLRLKHPISDTSSSSSSSSLSSTYYAGNSVIRSTSRHHYVFSRHLSIEKDNNKIRKDDDDDDDAINNAHKLMKDIGSNSSSSNITTNDGLNNSNSGSNNSNSRFDDKSSLNTLADNGDQPIQQTLSSNDEAVVSTQSLPDSSSALSPLDTPVSSSSTSSSSSPSSSSSTEQVEEIIPLNNQVINPKNVTTIGSTIHYAEQKYEDFEANLMKSINESNQRRFRFLLIGTLLTIIWISTVFGTRIRKMLTEETAGLAKETLENESLKIQTQVMMMMMMMMM